MDPNQLKIRDSYPKIRRNKLSFTWQQNMFVGESLNCRERNLTLDEFKSMFSKPRRGWRKCICHL